MKPQKIIIPLSIASFLLCLGLVLWFNTNQPWNNPHRVLDKQTVFSSFSEPPKTLDPAQSYSSDSSQLISQIYEPPLQYNYFLKPYHLEPLTLRSMPIIKYYDRNQKQQKTASNAKYTTFDFYLKDNIYFQPHPAFAKNHGNYRYHQLKKIKINSSFDFSDFKYSATRKLTAEDYVYQIKRLATPAYHCPIYSLLAKNIVGFANFHKNIQHDNPEVIWSYLKNHPMEGVKAMSPNHFQIKLYGVYPAFKYWLTMNFFAPIPWEAEAFSSTPIMQKKHLGLKWQPIGTGPFYFKSNNPNKEIILTKNPNYRKEYLTLPNQCSRETCAPFLSIQGKRLPLIKHFHFQLEKEYVPTWHKFMQGYYDFSGIHPDNFSQIIQINALGEMNLSPLVKERKIQLYKGTNLDIFYTGFNMLDPVVGGLDAKHRKLRQAIAIAMDDTEYISIFMNGRGIVAEGPIPPDLWPTKQALHNKTLYTTIKGKVSKKTLIEARKLLAESGYKNGIDPKTGKPLILHLDLAAQNGPDAKARFAWLRKQFRKLNIQLDIRATQYSRFQDKVRQGKTQLFTFGWLADYPDAENFLFLLFGPNSTIISQGVNASNYQNPKFDRAYRQLQKTSDPKIRNQLVIQMTHMLQRDQPWLWGVHSQTFALSHNWNGPRLLNPMVQNDLKYRSLNSTLRQAMQTQWNPPVVWPLWLLISLIILAVYSLIRLYQRQDKNPCIDINRDI
jgi:oligopeptide transport system substrate-binding protein